MGAREEPMEALAVTNHPGGQVKAAGTGSLGQKASKYLTFELGQEIYGLEILKVQEIIGIMNVTRVPGTPSYVRGVINLRGKVIPVADLRRRFGFPDHQDTERSCIIVVQVRIESQTVTMGIIVDEVKEVAALAPDQIEAPPELGIHVDTAFLLGVGKAAQKVTLLLDVDRVLARAAASPEVPAAPPEPKA